MDIFKLFESTIANIEPGHPSNKHLRRDQLLDNCDEATKTLQTLIKAKENEIAYRRDLIVMLERSKTIYDNKLKRAHQAYETAKKHAPDSFDLKKLNKDPKSDLDSAAPSTSSSSTQSVFATPTVSKPASLAAPSSQPQSSLRSSELDIPLPYETNENRSSLDRRLSEFLKTFPNLSQAGLAPQQNNNNDVKPLPGYYTQQPPPPSIATAPPMMAMLRFPPPPLVPSTVPPPRSDINSSSQENHDTADMDLSDYEEPINNGVAAGIIPMVASAMQQGAGGKSHIGPESQPYGSGQQFNNTIQYTHTLNPLPFDPSIMEPRLVRESSSSSGSRDKPHSDKGSHRHSSSSGSSNSGVKSADKSKNSSSSHSSSRSKRR